MYRSLSTLASFSVHLWHQNASQEEDEVENKREEKLEE
jgi:hypothetical protein